MPIYEYRCPSCGHAFERMMRMADSPPPCPACGHNAVDKLISATSFVLKGGGWYRDHYGLKSSGSAKPGGDGASKTSSDSATKPAPAAPSTSGGSTS